ncbi:MAG: CotH kinase family protein [Anaerolineae bacterium]|nr:CotH kinase family protein [Anaerolineae bacterium]
MPIRHNLIKFGFSVSVLLIVVMLYYNLPMRNGSFGQHWHTQLWGLNQLQFLEFKEKLRARISPSVDKRFVFSNQTSLSPEPVPSVTGGFYDHSLSVTLAIENGHEHSEAIAIHYTLDGSIPTEQSFRYQKPIPINETTVLRFRSFSPGSVPGATVTHTYFLGTNIDLPVISLVTDPVNLWSSHSGIYVHPLKRGRAWEREANVEYFDNLSHSSLSFPAGVRINGGWSRDLPKKSFRFTYSQTSLPETPIDNMLTANGPVDERTVVLRSSTDFRLRDSMFHSLYAEAGGYTSSFTPVMLFLNGELWGIYNLREKIDDEYLQRKVGEGHYVLIDETDIIGKSKKFEPLIDFLATHDLADNATFEQASQLIDLDNTTDYWLFNIYAANVDWLYNNMYAFKKLDDPDGRWHWIVWDVDDSFGIEVDAGYRHDTLAFATREELRPDLLPSYIEDQEDYLRSTLIIRKLLENDTFREEFIRRFCDLQNSILTPDHVEAAFNKVIALTSHDMPQDLSRWSLSEESYLEDIQSIRDFIRNRPEVLYASFQHKFHLGQLFTIQLFNEPNEGGDIQINTINPQAYPWEGRYFEDTRITLTAKPSPGFKFVGWTNPSLGNSPQIELQLHHNLSVGAIFERISK